MNLHEPAPAKRRIRPVAFRREPSASPDESPRSSFTKTWYLDIALRTGGSKLASTEQKLDRRLDLPLKLDVFGVFSHPTTPIDRKTDLALSTLAFGLGRRESEHFGWGLYAGFGAGADRNEQTFLLSELDVNFSYATAYTGFAAEYYPWVGPPGQPNMTWAQRLNRARPYLVGGIEVGYVSAEADGDFTFAGATLYKDGDTIRDWLVSVPIGIGLAIPLNDRWSLQTVADYRFHFYRPEEYNGWNLTTALRRRF